MDTNSKKRKKNVKWGSRFGFIMTTAGFSMGLGNMWRFPYLASKHGGGAFVIIYILIALFIGKPLFTMEMAFGRKSGQSPIVGARTINGKGSKWNFFPWAGVAAAFFILTYYIQIMGWILAYIYRNATGLFIGKSIDEVSYLFDSFRANSPMVLILTLVCFIIIGLVSSRGLQKGVEVACKFMLPILFVMLSLMAVSVLFLPGAIDGLVWYLKPDFSKITISTFLDALGQAFFSIGIASGGALVYGSYLKKDSDILTDGLIVVGFDTFGALISGALIFPAVFAMNMDMGKGGSGLLFSTMSKIFTQIPGGRIFGTVFFILVFFAAFSSALGYLEPIATTVRDLLKLNREQSVWASLAAIFIFGLPAVLANGPLQGFSVLGMNCFDFIDFFSGNMLMPIAAIAISFYTIFYWKFDQFALDSNEGAKGWLKVESWWKPLVYFFVPVSMVIIFVLGFWNNVIAYFLA